MTANRRAELEAKIEAAAADALDAGKVEVWRTFCVLLGDHGREAQLDLLRRLLEEEETRH
jgi:hypothetical protein